jgi:hypothetical protein
LPVAQLRGSMNRHAWIKLWMATKLHIQLHSFPAH